MPSLSSIYRPRIFADMIGQDAIRETLRLECETGKIGHAYLFAGPRGVGKTTAARIFAKALNCLHPHAGEPDNKCAACCDADAGNSLDQIEMDAASHTGVDNVREAIIENVRYAPQKKYKIYILDEAHMLSGSAWNALLKTIEEPPPYAVFLFLTTELHKVPATIQSRCQRFDFKRIGGEKLEARIVDLAGREGVQIDPAVVTSIVAKSDGCLRDAESLLGQLLALGEKNVTMDVASLVLPVSRLPLAAEILASWAARELGPSFAQIEELDTQGIPVLPLFDDLIAAVRFLLLASDSVAMRQKLAHGDEGEKKLAQLVSTYEPAELSHIALLLMERRRDAKAGADPRFCLELAASAVCLKLLPHSTATPPQPLLRKEGIVLPSPHSPEDSQPIQPSTFNLQPTAYSLPSILSSWSKFLSLMDECSPSLLFILKITKPGTLSGNRLTLNFAYAAHKQKILDDMKSRQRVVASLREATGLRDLEIDGIVVSEAVGTTPENVVSNILSAFGGHVV